MDHNTEIVDDGLFSLHQEKTKNHTSFFNYYTGKQDEILSSHISQDFFSSLLRTASLFWGKGVHTQNYKSHHKEQGIQITRYKHEHNSKTHTQ